MLYTSFFFSHCVCSPSGDLQLPLVMLIHYLLYLGADLLDVSLGLLDCGHPITLSLPPCNIGLHLVNAAVLLLYLVAELALALLVGRIIDQFQAARLACPVLLVALLTEVPPLPVAAGPARLFEVTHGEPLVFEGFRDRSSIA